MFDSTFNPYDGTYDGSWSPGDGDCEPPPGSSDDGHAGLTDSPSVLDVCADPNGALRWAVEAGPGPVVAMVLQVVDRSRLTPAGRVDLLLAATAQEAWATAAQYKALADIGAAHAELACVIDPDGKQFVVEEIRTALRVCADEAKCLLLSGQVLTEQLPTTLAHLESGRLSPRKAKVMCEQTSGLDPTVVPRFERLVLERASEQSYAAFRRAVTVASAKVSPQRQEDSRAEDMKDRRLCFTHRPNGMTELWALLPSEGALALQHAARALSAPSGPDDARELNQRQADSLVDMATWVLHQDCLPREQGVRPRIVVTMALETLLGLNDLPADLDGVGPLPASVARQLAHDPTGTWRRMIVDPVNGRCLDYGRTSYTPPADLREHIIATNRRCAFPGCGRAARRCDLDHHLAWEDGGETADANMGPLCSRHHHLKHETGWKLQKLDDGYQWTAPTGHVYYSRPDPYPTGSLDEPPPPTAWSDDSATADLVLAGATGESISPANQLPDDPPF
jgi:hypothetical protein